MSAFSNKIAFAVKRELVAAKQHENQGQYTKAFSHLENAHVLGQASTRWHVYVHYLMLVWGVKQKLPKECLGQIVRIVGAATKTALGMVPTGNTGGSNISPFKRLPIAPALQAKIANANK